LYNLKEILWKNELNNWEYELSKLIIYIEDLSKKCSGENELNIKLGVYQGFINRLIKKHNLKLNLKYDIKSNNPNFKAIYQNYEWCYEKYIIKGLNHKEMAKEANCSKRVIEKWCQEKHGITQKYRQIIKKLNNIQHNLIIGSMLGDGHIDKRETQPIFIVSHAENQKDYLYWKYDILKDLCNIPPTHRPEEIRIFFDKEYLCQKSYRICTRIYDCLLNYRSMTNINLLNQMNEFSFAIWILDDAYRKSSNWELCVAEYKQEEIDYAISLFSRLWDLISYQNKDKRYITFDAESSRKIDKIILNNIPNDLDIIKYKITNNDNLSNQQKFIMLNIDNKEIKLSDYCKENNLNYKRIINRTYKGVNIYDSIQMEVIK